MAACILARDTNRDLPTVRSCVSVSEVETRRDLAVRHEVLEEDRLLCAIGHSGDATAYQFDGGYERCPAAANTQAGPPHRPSRYCI